MNDSSSSEIFTAYQAFKNRNKKRTDNTEGIPNEIRSHTPLNHTLKMREERSSQIKMTPSNPLKRISDIRKQIDVLSPTGKSSTNHSKILDIPSVTKITTQASAKKKPTRFDELLNNYFNVGPAPKAQEEIRPKNAWKDSMERPTLLSTKLKGNGNADKEKTADKKPEKEKLERKTLLGFQSNVSSIEPQTTKNAAA